MGDDNWWLPGAPPERGNTDSPYPWAKVRHVPGTSIINPSTMLLSDSGECIAIVTVLNVKSGLQPQLSTSITQALDTAGDIAKTRRFIAAARHGEADAWKALEDERKACLRDIDACDAGGDCEDNLGTDMSTGAGECRRENRGEECVCGAVNDALMKAKERIRARGAPHPATEHRDAVIKERDAARESLMIAVGALDDIVSENGGVGAAADVALEALGVIRDRADKADNAKYATKLCEAKSVRIDSDSTVTAALYAWERAHGAADDGPRAYTQIDIDAMRAALRQGDRVDINMTKEERAILELTRDLWNAIVALPWQHPSDLPDTCRDIHNIQNRIMSRPFIRDSRINVPLILNKGKA